MELHVQSLSGEPLFSLDAEHSWTCEVLKEMAKKAVRDLPVTGRLGALLLDGQALVGEKTLEEVGLLNGSTVMAVIVPLTFSQENSDPRISVADDGKFLRLSGARSGVVSYPAACGPALKLGEIHYFEVKLLPMAPGEAPARRHISFRMGLCRKHPTYYLGKDPESWSFWFDDGDAYTGGARFHVGNLATSVPMGFDDRVGVLADFRMPGLPLEFVLNRRSTGPCSRTSNCYEDKLEDDIMPCVSFCTNHRGCAVEVTHLGPPPEDIIPFDAASDPLDPIPYLRPEDRQP